MKSLSRILAIIILCPLISGCGTYHARHYSGLGENPFEVDQHKISVSIEAARSDTHIPFIFWRIRKGEPYNIRIEVSSKQASGEILRINTVHLADKRNNIDADILNNPIEQPLVAKQYYNSSRHGLITNTIYKAEWSSDILPLKYIKNSRCILDVELFIGEQKINRTLEYKAIEKKETGSLFGWYANI